MVTVDPWEVLVSPVLMVSQVLMESLDLMVLKDLQVLLVTLVALDQLDDQDQWVFLEIKDRVESLEHRVTVVLMDQLVHQVHREKLAQLVEQDKQASRVSTEMRVMLEIQAPTDPRVKLVKLVMKVLLDHRDPKETVGLMVLMVQLAQEVHVVQEVRLEARAQQDLMDVQEHQGLREHKVEQDPVVKLERLVHLVHKVDQVPWASLVQWEIQVQQVQTGMLVHKEHVEIRDIKVAQEFREDVDPKVLLVLLATKVLRETLDAEEDKVQLDLVALEEDQDYQDPDHLLVNQGQWVLLDLKEPGVKTVNLEKLVVMVRLALAVLQALLDLLEPMASLEMMAVMVHLVLLVLKDPRVTVETKEPRVLLELLAWLDQLV